MSNLTVSALRITQYSVTRNKGRKFMRFRIGEKEYSGDSAVEIIHALQLDVLNEQRKTLREFLLWSMEQLSDRIPLRELDVSDKLSDEMLALDYLCLRQEYGAGELSASNSQGTGQRFGNDELTTAGIIRKPNLQARS